MATGFPGGASGKEPVCQCRRRKQVEVWSLAREDPLEEGMATHSRILAWRIPWTEEHGGLQSIALQRVRHDWSDFTHTHTHTHRSNRNTSNISGQDRGEEQRSEAGRGPVLLLQLREISPRTAKQGPRTLVTNRRWTKRRKGAEDAFKVKGKRSGLSRTASSGMLIQNDEHVSAGTAEEAGHSEGMRWLKAPPGISVVKGSGCLVPTLPGTAGQPPLGVKPGRPPPGAVPEWPPGQSARWKGLSTGHQWCPYCQILRSLQSSTLPALMLTFLASSSILKLSAPSDFRSAHSLCLLAFSNVLFLKSKDSWFTVLRSFLRCTSMSQLCVCICPLPREPPSHPPSHPSRLSQSTELGSLCNAAASHQLAILHVWVYIYVNGTFSIHPTLPSPPSPVPTSLFFKSASLLLPWK